MSRVVVVGAGVIGLSTAVRLQQILPTCQVTILADRFDVNTVSDGAAGIFRPTRELIKGVSVERSRKWIHDSWSWFKQLAISAEAGLCGINIMGGYHLYDTGHAYLEDPIYLKEVCPEFRPMHKAEHDLFPLKREHGMYMTTLMVECRWYMPWLLKRFREAGGNVVTRTIQDFQELTDEYDIIVNCCGLRAKELANDDKMLPIRGQMLRVRAPWIKHFTFIDHFTWIVPGRETVVVGGTRQVGQTDTSVDPKDTQDVYERACKAVPSLKNAEIQWVWAGLRPHREPLRLETETRKNAHSGKPYTVVHHYGHGGNGVALSWGTAVEAADLVKDALLNSKAKL